MDASSLVLLNKLRPNVGLFPRQPTHMRIIYTYVVTSKKWCCRDRLFYVWSSCFLRRIFIYHLFFIYLWVTGRDGSKNEPLKTTSAHTGVEKYYVLLVFAMNIAAPINPCLPPPEERAHKFRCCLEEENRGGGDQREQHKNKFNTSWHW